MDFVPLIDSIGEPATFAAIGLALGLGFGLLAERSGFCTRSAVLELSHGKRGTMLPLWLVAFATAVLATQLLVATGTINLLDTRFFGTAQSLSGAVFGGLLFGIGMVLARGCTSRLLVLGVSGNLRALSTLAIIALVAWATYQGPLVPLRNEISGLLMTSAIGTNDFAVASGLGSNTGIIAGIVLAISAIIVATRQRLPLSYALAGLAIGATIPLGWYLTFEFSQQIFEPVQADSLSYMRPLASTLIYAASGADEGFLSLDVGLIAGTILGAFVSAVAFRSFKFRTFAEPGAPHWTRYITGGALMGFGGILAVGCTIGAGFTGGSVLAISSLLALAAMLVSAVLTDYLLARPARTGALVAAE
jgi:uncharacterized membrane protein YedE/YeeE